MASIRPVIFSLPLFSFHACVPRVFVHACMTSGVARGLGHMRRGAARAAQVVAPLLRLPSAAGVVAGAACPRAGSLSRCHESSPQRGAPSPFMNMSVDPTDLV